MRVFKLNSAHQQTNLRSLHRGITVLSNRRVPLGRFKK